MDPYLEKLHAKVKRLDSLLSDPNPGMAGWCQMYGEVMTEISEMWLGDSAKDVRDVGNPELIAYSLPIFDENQDLVDRTKGSMTLAQLDEFIEAACRAIELGDVASLRDTMLELNMVDPELTRSQYLSGFPNHPGSNQD